MGEDGRMEVAWMKISDRIVVFFVQEVLAKREEIGL